MVQFFRLYRTLHIFHGLKYAALRYAKTFHDGVCRMNEWLYVGLFFIVGLIIPVGAIGVAWILGPKKPNPIKQSTYECGIEPVGEGWVQFKAQYYIFALVFLVFDVETVFLFPWAVRLGQLGMFAVMEGIVFILILIAGLVYTWRKGMLEWV
jgi:NADH:ubiquinone oxidoreductase subunit 3 (subunit A)